MNKKFFVPFKTAKLLKEKGYDTKVSFYYTTDGVLKSHAAFDREAWDGDPCLLDYSNSDLQKWYREENYIAAPTYHEVVDWLEEKGIYVSAFLCIGETDKEDTYKIWWKSFIDIPPYEEQSSAVCSTREEALNESILKALKKL